MGVDAGEQVDARLTIDRGVLAARGFWRGGWLGGWAGGGCGRAGAGGGAAGGAAAEAVAEQTHDGQIDGEPEKIAQSRGDGRRGGGRARGLIRLGRRGGDWRLPEGGLVRHVRFAFYTLARVWARVFLPGLG